MLYISAIVILVVFLLVLFFGFNNPFIDVLCKIVIMISLLHCFLYHT